MFKRIGSVGLILLLSVGLTGCNVEDKELENDVVMVEPYTKGKVDGNHFESSWLNMQVDFPNEVYMATEEQILQAQSIGSETLYGEDTQESINQANENGLVTYEMVAIYMDGNPNCSLVVEKLPFSILTEKQYLNATKQNLYSDINDDVNIVIHDETSEIEIAKETFTGIVCSITSEGKTMESETYVRIKSGYAIVFNVTYDKNTEDLKNQMIEAFKPLY